MDPCEVIGREVKVTDSLLIVFVRRRPIFGHRWIVGMRHGLRRMSKRHGAMMDERRLHMMMSALIPKASSIQWFLTKAGLIYRWSKPWRRSERGIQWQGARGQQPSTWTREEVATNISCSSFLLCRELLKKMKRKKNVMTRLSARDQQQVESLTEAPKSFFLVFFRFE